MKAFNAFITPQRSEKIKIEVIFYLNATFRNARGEKG